MANQHAMTLEAILNIKKAVARDRERAYDLVDNERLMITNHGNKLKRRAEFYHEGEMGGRMPVKRKIDHAGYTRSILRRNPKRFDEEAFELLSDEDDAEADKEAAEKNPYSGILIEEILRPLTQASELQSHPALSAPYKSPILPNLVEETLSMLHKERRTLMDMKRLMELLRGDAPWLPAGLFVQPDDIALFMNEKLPNGTYATIPLHPNLSKAPATQVTHSDEDEVERAKADPTLNGETLQDNTSLQLDPIVPDQTSPDLPMLPEKKVNGASDNIELSESHKAAEVEPKKEDELIEGNGLEVAMHLELTESGTNSKIDQAHPTEGSAGQAVPTENRLGDAVPTADGVETTIAELSKSSNPPTPSAISSPGSSPPARMQTRAQTNAANGTPHLATLSHSVSPGPSRPESPPTLHPLYLPTPYALPDRNAGLPPHECEDLRRLLSIYIQKQEEICRGSDRLYQGLLKALRLRDTVWWWCRAEEHCGEMSGNEDWYDKEEWGLDEDLRKGDVITEDNNVEEPSKKTRGRRAAA